MKRAKKGLIKNLTYLCLVGVIALGLMTIVGTGGGGGGESNTGPTATEIPSAPTGLTASAGNEQVTISWSAVSGATSYNIYWSETSGVTKTNGTQISDVTSPYTHTGLTNDTPYYYIVTAVNSYGESVESEELSAAPTGGGTSLTKVGTYNTPDWTQPVYVTGTKVIIGFSYGFEIVDISNPATPTLLVHKTLSFDPKDFHVVNNTTLYIAGNTGLYVCNIQNPAQPTSPQLIYTEPRFDVMVVGNLAYGTGYVPGGMGLNIIDLSDNRLLGYYDTPCCAKSVYVSGNYAYVAAGPDGGLQIIDVTNPDNPVRVGQYLGVGYALDVSVKDNYAYVGADDFQIIDVSNRTAPALVSKTNVWGTAGSVFVSGNRAFVSSQELNMFDITNPTSSKLLATYEGLIAGSNVHGNQTHVVVTSYNKMYVFAY